MVPSDGPTCGLGSTIETSESSKIYRSSSCSSSIVLFFRLITRRALRFAGSEMVDLLRNSKSKFRPEKRDDALVVAESGDVEETEADDSDADDGLNTVLRR